MFSFRIEVRELHRFLHDLAAVEELAHAELPPGYVGYLLGDPPAALFPRIRFILELIPGTESRPAKLLFFEGGNGEREVLPEALSRQILLSCRLQKLNGARHLLPECSYVRHGTPFEARGRIGLLLRRLNERLPSRKGVLVPFRSVLLQLLELCPRSRDRDQRLPRRSFLQLVLFRIFNRIEVLQGALKNAAELLRPGDRRILIRNPKFRRGLLLRLDGLYFQGSRRFFGHLYETSIPQSAPIPQSAGAASLRLKGTQVYYADCSRRQQRQLNRKQVVLSAGIFSHQNRSGDTICRNG